MGLFNRWTISIKHFKNSEIEAQKKALSFTNQIKELLLSNEVVAIEKLLGIEQLGEEGIKILEKFITAFQSDAIAKDLELADALLGRLGAELTGLIHEGCSVLKDIQNWIILFEGLFKLAKK